MENAPQYENFNGENNVFTHWQSNMEMDNSEFIDEFTILPPTMIAEKDAFPCDRWISHLSWELPIEFGDFSSHVWWHHGIFG